MLLEEFSVIFDRPEKIKKLREYILSLAVRGKLVPQDENDEPASVLLDRIKQEKDRLVKSKIIKKEKPLPEINEDEIPYQLPNGWKWIRLGDLGITQTGTTPSTKKAEYFGGNIPFIKPADISDTGVNYFNETLTEEGLNVGREVLPNSLLMVCIGTIGKSYFVDRRCSCNQQINFITFLDKIDAKIIYYFANSPYFYDEIMKQATGTTMLIVNKSKWERIIIPIPPLNEQKRIVNKIDYLMDFCDKLEKQLEKEVKHASLSVKSVLNNVNNYSTYEDLEETLRFIIENFNDLTLADGAVGELKNTILSLAVRGKLVPQNEKDEPASVLLDRIKQEKDRLVKEKIIKKEKPLPEINKNDIPYELPKGWEWIRLGSITEKLGAGSTPSGGSKVYTNEGIKFIRSQNVYNDGLRTTDIAYIPLEINEKMKGSVVVPGDILLNITGGSIGRSCLVDDKFDIGNVNQHVSIVRLVNKDMREYIHSVIISPYIQQKIMDVQVGVSREGLSMTKLSQFLIPVPPLNEQKRILEKVKILMKICDELELKIEKIKKYSEQLMESILKESFRA